MAVLRIMIPDSELQRVLTGLSTELGYEPILLDGNSNPQTRLEFCREAVQTFMLRHLKNYEGRRAAQAEQRKTDTTIENLGITVI